MMVRESTIPPPITEQNIDEYLQELDNFKQADDWVKKHSKSAFATPLDALLNRIQALLV